MKYSITLLFLTFILFASCKKDSVKALSYPQTFVLNKLIVKTKFKVYTKDGEITNPAVISNFKSNPLFNSLEDKDLDPTQSITFLSPDSAVFGSSTTKFLIDKTGEQFLFYSPLIVQGSYTNPIYNIPKYISDKKVASPNNSDYLTKQVRVGYDNYNGLKISKLSYLLKTGNTNFQSGTLLNELNQNISAELRSVDTLAVQEYTLIYNVK